MVWRTIEKWRQKTQELNGSWKAALNVGRHLNCQLGCQLSSASVRSPANTDPKLFRSRLIEARFVDIPLTDTVDTVAALV